MIKMYGPYLRKDGRKHVVFYDTEAKTYRTQSYPRYLMEQHLGRELDISLETVDHIDYNYANDSLDNLQLLTNSENAKKSNGVCAEVWNVVCVECGTTFSRIARKERRRIKKNRKGPYCSKRCSGIQNH